MRFFKYTDSKESTHNWLFSNEMEKKPTLIWGERLCCDLCAYFLENCRKYCWSYTNKIERICLYSITTRDSQF